MNFILAKQGNANGIFIVLDLHRFVEHHSTLQYNGGMSMSLTPQPPSILDQLLAPVGACLTPEVARHLIGLHASPEIQERLEILADKSSEGQLSIDERSEYATAVAAIEFISVLQAKAREILHQDSV